jgi:hypothetical protein
VVKVSRTRGPFSGPRGRRFKSCLPDSEGRDVSRETGASRPSSFQGPPEYDRNMTATGRACRPSRLRRSHLRAGDGACDDLPRRPDYCAGRVPELAKLAPFTTADIDFIDQPHGLTHAEVVRTAVPVRVEGLRAGCAM